MKARGKRAREIAAKKRAKAARKGWEARREKARARSRAAKKGWETRREKARRPKATRKPANRKPKPPKPTRRPVLVLVQGMRGKAPVPTATVSDRERRRQAISRQVILEHPRLPGETTFQHRARIVAHLDLELRTQGKPFRALTASERLRRRIAWRLDQGRDLRDLSDELGESEQSLYTFFYSPGFAVKAA